MLPLAIVVNILIFWSQWRLTFVGGRAALKQRLNSYALMKPDYTPCKAHECLPLSKIEHEVLLGILKKVEAKNSALTTIWAFLAAALISIASSTNDRTVDVFAGFSIFLLTPYFVAAIFGTRQLDQVRFLALKATALDETGVTVKLQEDLMSDVLRKELGFRFSWLGALVVVPMMFLIIGLSLVYTPSWTEYLK